MFFLLGSSLQGKTLGVVGMGGIGQATARRAKAFGMDIVYQSRSEIDPTIAAELDARRVDLDELLAVSDVVSLHCPYGPATHHLIGGAEQLAAMKSSAFLVNTARDQSSTKTHWQQPSAKVQSREPDLTSTSKNHASIPACWNWTTSPSCRTSAQPRWKRVQPWPCSPPTTHWQY